MTLLQIEEKIEHNQVIVCRTFLDKIPQIATGNNCCIKTRQSWDFGPTIFNSRIDTKLLIFEEYPYGTLTKKIDFFYKQNLYVVHKICM